MMMLVEPSSSALVEAVSVALREKVGTVDAMEFHQRVKKMYSWDRVARQTEQLYHHALGQERLTFLQRIERYRTTGPVIGILACLVALMVQLLSAIMDWLQPISTIDIVPDLILLKSSAPTMASCSCTTDEATSDGHSSI
jgi:phosphatidylinositol glycan class A protein